MDKTNFQKIVKKYFIEKGFQFKGTKGYKMIDNTYLIGVCLEHHSYCKAYRIDYGVVYLPDEKKVPFSGWYDWHDEFLFTQKPGEDLEQYAIGNIDDYDESNLVDYFEYESRDKQELLEQLEINENRKMELIMDKEFVLSHYSNNLNVFARLPDCTIEKLIRLWEFDVSEISRLRKQWGYDKCEF